jgi:hypothetical protein
METPKLFVSWPTEEEQHLLKADVHAKNVANTLHFSSISKFTTLET